MKPKNEMGFIVRGVRSLLGMNQGDLADALNITRTTLHDVENGNKKWVRIDTVGKALDLFQTKGVGVYENEDYYVILVTKQK